MNFYPNLLNGSSVVSVLLLQPAFTRYIDLALTGNHKFFSNLCIVFNLDITLNLNQEKLRYLIAQILQVAETSCPKLDREILKRRMLNEKEWIRILQKICIDRRNIGHDWQFTDEQAELLYQPTFRS